MGHVASPVTMRTLADRLGVSVTTVSNAYSKPDRLSPELREQVLATAKELGYCGPSAAGRALRSGKTDVCGFLFGGELAEAFADPYTVTFLGGLGESVERYGASVLLLARRPGMKGFRGHCSCSGQPSTPSSPALRSPSTRQPSC